MLRIESMTLLNGKEVNFSLKQGEAIIIQGKNGSGKSLFLKSVARLIPAKAKTFEYQGKDVKTFKSEAFRSEVLYVSTTPFFMGEGTASDFIRSAFELEAYKGHKTTFPYEDYLRKWNLTDLEFTKLSSGQKQMVSILRALSLKARILLLDEPTANLDYEKTLEIEKLLINWRKETRGGLVMICHSHDQAKRLDFRIVDF